MKKNDAHQFQKPKSSYQLSGEVASLLSAYSSLTITDTGKVQCRLSGHEMPAKAEAIRTYLDGSAYRRAESRSRVDLDALLPYIVPSRTSPHKLFCKLTQREINYLADEVTAHMTGAKFLRLKAIADEEAKKEEEEKARRAAKKAAWEASQMDNNEESGIGHSEKGQSKRKKTGGVTEDETDEAAFVAAMDATIMESDKNWESAMLEEEDDEEEEEEEKEEEEDDDKKKKALISKHVVSKKRSKKSEPTSRIFLPSEVVENDKEAFIEAKKISKRGSVIIDVDDDNRGAKVEAAGPSRKVKKETTITKDVAKSHQKNKGKDEIDSIKIGERRERDASSNAGQLKKKKVKREGSSS
jgi:hypothetical protein